MEMVKSTSGRTHIAKSTFPASISIINAQIKRITKSYGHSCQNSLHCTQYAFGATPSAISVGQWTKWSLPVASGWAKKNMQRFNEFLRRSLFGWNLWMQESIEGESWIVERGGNSIRMADDTLCQPHARYIHSTLCTWTVDTPLNICTKVDSFYDASTSM